jgi:hypothetical protein
MPASAAPRVTPSHSAFRLVTDGERSALGNALVASVKRQ